MRTLIILVLMSCFMGNCWALEAKPDFNLLCDAIYQAENSSKYPYGIKSIDTHGDKDYARQICLNTVKNNWERWRIAGEPKPFIEFLGDRYCPKADDSKGHAVWAKNVYHWYNQFENQAKQAIG